MAIGVSFRPQKPGGQALSLDVIGVRDIQFMLDYLGKRAVRKIARDALRPAMRYTLNKAKQITPVRKARTRAERYTSRGQLRKHQTAAGSGTLRKSLKLRSGDTSRKWISFRVGHRQELFKKYYPPYVEWGFKRGGRKVEGQGYLREATRSTKKQVFWAFRRKFMPAIQKASIAKRTGQAFYIGKKRVI